MPVSRPRIVKCKVCKNHFVVMIGDIRPQRIECPKCKYVWFYIGT